ERILARERGLGELELAPFRREHLIVPDDLDFADLVVIEERADRAETDQLAHRVADEELDVDPPRRLPLLAHLLGLSAPDRVPLLRELVVDDRRLPQPP